MSFSNVKYDEIAAYVWLDPNAEGSDIRPLETFRSRIPKNIFRNICIDVDKAMVQYGRMESHETEEARSRFIASVSSSCTVSHSVDSDREKKNAAIFGDSFSVRKHSGQQTGRITGF